ncbi:hypothetical protein ACIGW0_25850 [Streptomyces bikiniensis]|uniref:Uncharacterized protein n=1 Tax=Streptomyces bikiniensis TaxID=1896 RepID=A0ABW8CYV2_STRBI
MTDAITSTTSFADSDLRGSLLQFTEQARTANQALVDLLSAIARRKGGHHRADRTGLAAGPAPPSIVSIPGTLKIHRL